MSDPQAAKKRVWRSGVRFDCPECGNLWRDDEHAERLPRCPSCEGILRLVGMGERMVEFAKWYRCTSCNGLFMRRRGEIVATKPRSGFADYAMTGWVRATRPQAPACHGPITQTLSGIQGAACPLRVPMMR